VKNILILGTQPQRFLAQLEFANQIKNTTNKFKVFFFISEKVYLKYLDIVDNLNFNIINYQDLKTCSPKKKNIKFSIKKKIKKILNDKHIKQIKEFFYFFKNLKFFTKSFENQEILFLDNLKKMYEKISKQVLKNKIDILLINGDRNLGYEPIFIKISKEFNIPSIIVYLVDYADEERILKNEIKTKKLKPNLFISKYIIKSQKNLNYKILKDRYYYTHPAANALKKFGVLTSNPFVMGCGYSDIICLNNDYNKDLYVSRGVVEKKIKVLGDANYDHLFKQQLKKKEIKQNLRKKYKLDEKRIIILAPPQLGEHNLLPWDEHWNEINFLFKNTTDLDVNVLVSLHPKMEIENYRFLGQKYKCHIIEENLVDVLPAADMFVAGFSSTLNWSILCGINSILLDFYGLNYSMFDHIKSVSKVKKRNDLKNILTNTLNSKIDFREDWKKLSKEKVFDGNTTDRYINLFKELLNVS
jgi:hypothetical protein